MGINRYKNHLTIFLEDRPYREILNGVRISEKINNTIFDVKNPCGGWAKVFEALKNNLQLINNNIHQHVLILMDFDNDYKSRIFLFEQIISNQPCADRVFLLGIDKKESENLKRHLDISNNELIGKMLIDDCLLSSGNHQHWNNHHLACNDQQLLKMYDNKVFEWVFQK